MMKAVSVKVVKTFQLMPGACSYKELGDRGIEGKFPSLSHKAQRPLQVCSFNSALSSCIKGMCPPMPAVSFTSSQDELVQETAVK